MATPSSTQAPVSHTGYKFGFNAAATASVYTTGKLAFWGVSKTLQASYNYLLSPAFGLVAKISPNRLKVALAPAKGFAKRASYGIHSAMPSARLMLLAKITVATGIALFYRKEAIRIVGIITLMLANYTHLNSETQKNLMAFFIRCGLLDGRDKDFLKDTACDLLREGLLDAYEVFLDHAIAMKKASKPLHDFNIDALPSNLKEHSDPEEVARLLQKTIQSDLGWMNIGIEFRGPYSQPEDKEFIVVWAARNNCLDFVKWLETAGANMHYQESAYAAAKSGAVEALNHLLESFTNKWPAQSEDTAQIQRTLWLKAAQSDDPKVALALKEDEKVENRALHAYNCEDQKITPLQYALCHSSAQTIQALDSVCPGDAFVEIEVVATTKKTSYHHTARCIPEEIKDIAKEGDTALMLLVRRIHKQSANHTHSQALTKIALDWVASEALTAEKLALENAKGEAALSLAKELLGEDAALTTQIRQKLRSEERSSAEARSPG